jgi:hypothetical protein
MVAVIRRADHRVMPWKNGQGVTREVHVAPGPGAHGFDWRVSIATIDRAGPFSTYAGVDRTIMVIDGEGMILDVDGVPHRIGELFLPFGFRGESTVLCTPIRGRIHDFNAMADRARCSARVMVARLADGEERSREVASPALLACLAGRVAVRVGAETPVTLEPWDSVRLAESAPVAARALGRAAIAWVLIGAPTRA